MTHPAVTMLVAVRAGSGHDPAERVGLAHFVSKVIDRGTALRTADEVAEALDGGGDSLNSSVGRHLLTLGCTCLAEDFGDMLDLVADIVRHPTFLAKRSRPGAVRSSPRSARTRTALPRWPSMG